MRYEKLGMSELNVSRICMGCMGFGDASNGQHSWTIDENIRARLSGADWNLELTFLTRPLVIKMVPVNSILDGH